MPKIGFSPHAEYEMKYRELDRKLVEETVMNPDEIVQGRLRRKVYQKIFFKTETTTPVLYRVVVEENAESYFVVTAYKTSQIERYLRKN
jgi:hypothetical protein